ncbi:MAG: serine/threonine protein kinase [Candidatus Dormibacteraeota bacterium]|nr:serine/threonine protein kinase [Candidatus Dormibacteraeota bacterium]
MIQTDKPVHLPDISGVELLGEIGRGGMGVVHLARQAKLDRLVAVKLLRSWTGVDDDLVERFLREARAAALTDAAIVPLYDVGAAGDIHYLLMAYMPGGSLRQVIESRRLAPAEVAMAGRRIAGALATAHAAGVLHRDVKPSNILLDARGNPFLSDFGIAQLSRLTRLTRSGASPGTAEYMAPELATGAVHSEAADIYSLGATLYECLTGEPPFTGANDLAVIYRHSHDPVPPLPDDVPEALAQAIIRSLAKEPDERFPNAAALETALAEVPTEPIAVDRETVPSVSSARPLLSAPPAADVFRPTLSVVGRRPAGSAPKGPGRLGRLRAAVPPRLPALGAGALIAVLALVTLGTVVLPRVIHPGSRPAPPHHRVAATARPAPTPTPAPAATAAASGPVVRSAPTTAPTATPGLPPLTFQQSQIAGAGGCCFNLTGAWATNVPQGGYPNFQGPIAWSTDTAASATWTLGATSGGQRWDQVRVLVWIPNTMAGAWVAYTVTATAGGSPTTHTYQVPQQANMGWYTLGTFAAGTATQRTGSITVRMSYVMPYQGPAADSRCTSAGLCTEMAAAQAMFQWS